MSNYNATRSIWCGKKYFSSIINVHHNPARSVTAATATEKLEDPSLANAKPFDEIPGPRSLPLIGGSWVYMPIIGRYKLTEHHKADLHKNKIYGSTVREKFGPVSLVSSFEAETMKTLYQHEGQYPVRGEIHSLKAYRDSRPQWFNTRGILVLNGKEWYDLRFKLQKHLMKPKSIQAFLNPMQDVAKDMISLIRYRRDANQEVPDLLGDLYKWALESVAYTGLDTRLDCLNPKLTPDSDGMKMINSVQTQFACVNKLEPFSGNFPFWKYLPSPTYKKLEKASDTFCELAFKYINRSLEKLKERKDDDSDLTLLQSMLATKDLEVSDAMVMVADMLFAGIDTTSHTIGFFLYTLAKNPEHQEKVLQEIRDLLPNKEDRITPENFNSFHYLKACLKESIRMYPISRGNARTLDHDVAINGYRVPAGTIIFCALQVIYRNEKYFKNADQFIPDRWLEKTQKIENPFAYVPFGIGTRACIGRRLAELEMICLAVELLRNFKVEYHHQDLGMQTRLVNTPDRPLRFNFLDR